MRSTDALPLELASMPRLVVTGSESTGKTTLATQLAARLDTVACPEFSREYADRRRGPLDRHDVEVIAVGQIAAEDRYTRRARHLLVLDTDLFSTVVYGRHYYGAIEPWIERVAEERRGSLYLLMDIDVPWVADPQRDRGDRRTEIHGLFRDILARHALPHVVIGGRWDERLERAMQVVRERVRPRT